MRVSVFSNGLGIGGTEKAAVRWALGLHDRGHHVTFVSLSDGPRRAQLDDMLPVRIVAAEAAAIASLLRELRPDVIHAHAPGQPHRGDVLGAAMATIPKIPVVQTNVFGRLSNPAEDAWTDFRLFISWTSCVQAARRSGRRLDESFFRHASVAVYPLDPVEAAGGVSVAAFRESIGVAADEVLLGRIARPDHVKWTDLVVDAFRLAHRTNPSIKLLLREPPPEVAASLRAAPDADRFVILEATSDPDELLLTASSLDIVLHTSSIGESFGYGIAEPMMLGRPVITHSVPWRDQAQIELVRHGECGYVTSTPETMSRAVLRLASSAAVRAEMGAAARRHITTLTDPEESLDRLESALRAAVDGTPNPLAEEDRRRAKAAAAHLDRHEFGHSLGEQFALRKRSLRLRLEEIRHRA